MLGQGLVPIAYHPVADVMSDEDLREYFGKMKKYVSGVVDALPRHTDYLNTYCRADNI